MNKQLLGYKNAFFSFVCVQFSSGMKYKVSSDGDIHMMNYDPYIDSSFWRSAMKTGNCSYKLKLPILIII